MEPENGQNGFENNHLPQISPIPDLPEGVVWYSDNIDEIDNKSSITDSVIVEKKAILV